MIAEVFANQGYDLYSFETKKGVTVHKMIDFLITYLFSNSELNIGRLVIIGTYYVDPIKSTERIEQFIKASDYVSTTVIHFDF